MHGLPERAGQSAPSSTPEQTDTVEQGIGIYLHIPYCLSKCPYCDFNSVAASAWPEAEYVAALERELATYAQDEVFSGAHISSVYFGGGTPSLFAPRSFERILERIEQLWGLPSGVEVTIEANPGTVDFPKLAALRAAGINRLSFGVQSFQPKYLALLGRIHSATEAIAAVEAASRSGFTNLNVDLIYALPGQTEAEWEDDLRQACALGPTHISAYNLTYEEGTPFAAWRRNGRLVPVGEDTEIQLFQLTEHYLRARGYERYEISNYARRHAACRHNLGYWKSSAYVGVGAGAHGFQPRGGLHGWGYRWANERAPHRYLRAVEERGHARVAVEHRDRKTAAGEFVFLALRCVDGVNAAEYCRRFGQRLEEDFPVIAELEGSGLLEVTAQGWRLSSRGTLLADSVFAHFL